MIVVIASAALVAHILASLRVCVFGEARLGWLLRIVSGAGQCQRRQRRRASLAWPLCIVLEILIVAVLEGDDAHHRRARLAVQLLH